MRSLKLLGLLAALVAASMTTGTLRAGSSRTGNACEDMIQMAISDVNHLRPGMTRSDLEKSFQQDGGMQPLDDNVYRYVKCPYIKIRVVFKNDHPDVLYKESPRNIIRSVSKPYLEYAFSD